MKGKRHTPDQIIAKLREADAMLGTGATIGQVCQKLAVTEATFHRWRNQYGGMKAEEAKRLKELEVENSPLKKSGSGAGQGDLERDLGGKLLSPARRRVAVTAQQHKEVSERRACQVLGQPRSSQRYRVKEDQEEKRLVERLHELRRFNSHLRNLGTI
jgi:hypothetical protein